MAGYLCIFFIFYFSRVGVNALFFTALEPVNSTRRSFLEHLSGIWVYRGGCKFVYVSVRVHARSSAGLYKTRRNSDEEERRKKVLKIR